MGIDIDRVEFTPGDFAQFHSRLKEQLARLKSVIAHNDFGQSSPALGAELELYIVDNHGRPLAINEQILTLADDPLLTPELNSYNLEYNLAPCALNNSPFHHLENAITTKLASLNTIAANLDGRLVAIGILPTLMKEDLGPNYMTQRLRYHALVQQLLKRRGAQFNIDINGQDPLQYALADITLEGANTSFQIHYQVHPNTYADTYNSLQLATPLAVALAANSPTLFGHSLWQETRIPLFKQSIDTRQVDRYEWNEPARVNFGHGWLRHGAYELFQESVALYPTLLPICAETKSQSNPVVDEQNCPELAELCLHQGTVWLWNRPVYDARNQGHLRIEMRALPSGPTAIDMMANAAFLIGITEGLRPSINELLPAIPFQTAEYNFYRSAQFGLDAQIIWPDTIKGYAKQAITQVIEDHLDIAKTGLTTIGIDDRESLYYLSVIEKRLRSKQNGAAWQLLSLEQLNQKNNHSEALLGMLDCFIHNSQTNTPIAEWPIGAKL